MACIRMQGRALEAAGRGRYCMREEGTGEGRKEGTGEGKGRDGSVYAWARRS